MKRLLGCCVAVLLTTGVVSAQTWPDYHLTNGTHNTSYGVEDYSPLYPKNLYIDPTATLQAGSDQLDDIYDGNQVYLNGGTVYASSIDQNDFSWGSGNLHLTGGTHYTRYGLGSGTGKTLDVDSGAALAVDMSTPLASGNQLRINPLGTLSTGDIDVSMDGFHLGLGATLEVSGTLANLNQLKYAQNVVLSGENASWDVSGALTVDGSEWVVVNQGARLTSQGAFMESGDRFSIDVSGSDSHWESTGGVNVRSLRIADGGSVTCGGISMGERFGGGYRISVTGDNSQLDAASITVGGERSSGNSLTISDGGVVNSVSGNIGASEKNYGLWGAFNNHVVVSGSGSQWNNSDELRIGSESCTLHVLEGASVTSFGASVGLDEWGFGARNNQAFVSGTGSKWGNNGDLSIKGGYGGNGITISNGGEVAVSGNISITQGPFDPYDGDNFLIIDDGGQLSVGSNFDASQTGFNFNSGGTLAVAGQLSGLSSLEAGHRLETPDVLGDMTVHGNYAPGNDPADSIINGMLIMGTNGVLEMEIGGEVLGYNYDSLTVTGATALAGTLDVLFVDGYSPSNTVSFDLFNWDGGVTGRFDTVHLPELPMHLNWNTNELYTSGILSVVPSIFYVSLDDHIRPINLKSKGRTQVSIMTTEDFDATTIDPSTVRLAGASPVHWKMNDVDGDGDIDLKLHFMTQDLDIDPDGEVTLIGQTYEGVLLEGMDTVKIVPGAK